MNELHRDLESYLQRGTLVFPSEIAAEHWRRTAISTGSGAVREDRIISWDTFKEVAFEIRSEALPANRTIRTVFSESLIVRNAAEVMMKELIPPAFATEASSFAPSIESVLPRLPAALTLLRRADGRLGRISDDLQLIWEEYSEFLETHGLFEPRWLQAGWHFKGGKFILVATDLIDDYPEFRAALAHLPRFQPLEDPDVSLQVFPEARSELASVLSSVAALLDSGTDPEDILISVADLDNLRDRFRHEAEKVDVPIALRSGSNLSESAFGRFVRDIGETVASGFGVSNVERLVLNAAVPWRETNAAAELVLRGVANGALGGGRGPDPRWKRALYDRTPVDGSPVGFGRALMSLLPRITKAPTFSGMREALNILLNTLVERERWQAADDRVIERAQEELRGLCEIEKRMGLSVKDPFKFWLDRLAEHQYVPQSHETAVPVVSYRVGAATYPLHHFVINTTHQATSVTVRSLPFLNDADRESLGDELPDRDLSVPFLKAYTGSGANLHISSSRQTFGGAALPAGFFVATGRIGVGAAGRGVTNTDDSTNPTLATGAREYLRGAPIGHSDFTRQPISSSDLLSLVGARTESTRSPGSVRLSASSIDHFRNCPFQYFLIHGLGLGELRLTLAPEDPTELGNLYHDIFAEFFRELAAEGLTFDITRLEEMRERLRLIADKYHDRGRGMIPDIVYAARRELFDRIAAALLENDSILISGHEPLLAEEWQGEIDPTEGYVLRGRVDRVTRAPDGSVTLVDYKKSTVPSNTSMNAGSREAQGAVDLTLLGSVQIPVYVRMLESTGHTVSAAGYHSLEKARYHPAIGESGEFKPAMTRSRFDEVMTALDTIIQGMVSRVKKGDFTCNPRCDGCRLRSICRTRYHVR